MADVSPPLAATATTLPVDVSKAPETIATPVADPKPPGESTPADAGKEKPEEKPEEKTQDKLIAAPAGEATTSISKPLTLTEPPAEPAAPVEAVTNGQKDGKPATETNGTSATKDVDMKDTGATVSPPATESTDPETTDTIVGEKRKVDSNNESVSPENGVLPLTEAPTTETNGESAAKKVKTDAEAGAPASASVTETDKSTEKTTAALDTAEAVGQVDTGTKATAKAKREKKAVPPVGRTARKTRSQGPVDA